MGDLKKNVRFILDKSGRQKYKMLISVVSTVLSSIFGLAPYALIYKIVMLLTSGIGDVSRIKVYVYYTIIAIALNIIFTLLGLSFSHIAAFSILYEIRMKALNHLGKLNMGFFRKHTSGEIKKAIDEDVEKLELFIAHQIPDLAESIAIPIIIIVYLLILNWKLALTLFIPLILSFAMQTWIYRGYDAYMDDFNRIKTNLNSVIVQYIHGINLFKAFNLTAKSFKKYRDATEDYFNIWKRITHLTVPGYARGMVVIDSGLLFIIPIGGYMFLTNGLSLSSFVVFLLLSSVFLTSFQKLTELGANFAMLICGAENVRKIMETKPQDNFGEISMANTCGKIQFENVNFKYEDEYVLKNFSLNVEPNSTIALVGPSGSGKTTAGMLVGRFWDVDEGKILIDGKDIKEYKQESLMENTAFVFQDVFMLNDTVYNNILMGMDRTEEEVIEAAKKAQIHDFIMSLEDGYQTVVGENTGIKLSGGEKQRISIARAILKDVKIVVLDEVTSYSDIENEKKIQDALKNLLKNKTAIIIAHRLYTIKNVDKIVVLDEGRIVEQGKHEDLINRNGLYNRLWNIGMEG